MKDATERVGMVLGTICMFGCLFILALHSYGDPALRAGLYPWFKLLGTGLACAGFVLLATLLHKYFTGAKSASADTDWIVQMHKLVLAKDANMDMYPCTTPLIKGFWFKGVLYFGEKKNTDDDDVMKIGADCVITRVEPGEMLRIHQEIMAEAEEKARKRKEATMGELAALFKKIDESMVAANEDKFPKEGCSCDRCVKAREPMTQTPEAQAASAGEETKCGDATCKVCADPAAQA